jgi:hypothetical protein
MNWTGERALRINGAEQVFCAYRITREEALELLNLSDYTPAWYNVREIAVRPN